MRQIVASNQSGVLPVARVVGNDYLYVWSRTISGLQQHYKTTTWSNFLLSRDDNPYSRSNEKSFYIYAENCVGRKRAGKDRSVAPRRQPTLAGESSSGPGERRMGECELANAGEWVKSCPFLSGVVANGSKCSHSLV